MHKRTLFTIKMTNLFKKSKISTNEMKILSGLIGAQSRLRFLITQLTYHKIMKIMK